ncbi:MAG TPA: DUF2061 domain-containing protein [Hanamia sp.]|jgi:uncharacterized membrane protein|nr:DUF2061 domain-containing protein [Hanamia sp.]
MILDLFVKNKIQVSEKGKDHLISFAKGISWRLIGTIDTIIISYLITGQWKFALSIGSVEVFTKIVLFYFHERTWLYFTNKT